MVSLYCQFWAFQTPCNASILSWPTEIWQEPIKHNFGVFSLTWVTNCGGCVWLVPALQHGVVCGIPSFVPPAGKWQNLPNVYAECGGGKSKGSPVASLQSNHKPLIPTWLWKFTSPPSLSTELRPRGMTLLNKAQLEVFLERSTAGVCSAAGSSLDGVQLETAPAFHTTNSAAAMGTIPTPNPSWVSIWVQETAQEQKKTSLFSWEVHGVFWNRTGCAFSRCQGGQKPKEGIWIPCSVSPEQSGQLINWFINYTVQPS